MKTSIFVTALLSAGLIVNASSSTKSERKNVMNYRALCDTAAALDKVPPRFAVTPEREKALYQIDELLKEPEAVKPKSTVRHGANAQIQHFCGNCNSMLHGKPKFCSECGKGVLW